MSFNEARKIYNALREFDKTIDQAVTEMGSLALNHFKQSFRDQGFTDERFKAWKPRKDKRDRYRKGRVRSASGGTPSLNLGRAVLVKTGALRHALRKQRKGRLAVRILANSLVDDYASVHNEGLRSGRGSGFKMPKRQFVGYSERLDKKIAGKIDKRIRQIFK